MSRGVASKGMAIVVALALAVRADVTVRQHITLKPGWNAVYVDEAPSITQAYPSTTVSDGEVLLVASDVQSDWSGVLNVSPMAGPDFGSDSSKAHEPHAPGPNHACRRHDHQARQPPDGARAGVAGST